MIYVVDSQLRRLKNLKFGYWSENNLATLLEWLTNINLQPFLLKKLGNCWLWVDCVSWQLKQNTHNAILKECWILLSIGFRSLSPFCYIVDLQLGPIFRFHKSFFWVTILLWKMFSNVWKPFHICLFVCSHFNSHMLKSNVFVLRHDTNTHLNSKSHIG